MVADVWVNGRFVERAGSIDAADRGLLLGDGVFDTALVLGGTVFRQDDHLDRLMRAAHRLDIPVARQAVETAMEALASRRIDGSIRLTLTRGPGPRGLALPREAAPTLIGTSAPLSPPTMFAPLKLAIAASRRNETAPTSRIKSLGYLDTVLADRDAKLQGADEALFLNTRDRLACSALANVFVVDGRTLLTPPREDGVLDGVTRKWVLENAARFGFSAQETAIGADALDGRAMFLTNSLRLLAPAAIDGAPGHADHGALLPMMMGLCEAIAAACGTDPRERGARLPDPG